MSDLASRLAERLSLHFGEIARNMAETLVTNRQMTNDEVHWHRGFIASALEAAEDAKEELKKLREE